jgi:hypothetical protein
MANANTPFGLSPVQHQSSGVFTGGVRTYCVPVGDGTALFIGDPVKLAGTGEIVDGVPYQDVIKANTGDVMAGVVVGFAPLPTSLETRYRVASTVRLVYVDDNPNTLFEIQEVGTGTALTLNDVGLNINWVNASGSTYTGKSGVVLDNTTEATTNTLDLHIVGLSARANNAVGAYAKWYVRINRHQFANQVAGI